jgi:heme-degrading monooxygenase HmoA
MSIRSNLSAFLFLVACTGEPGDDTGADSSGGSTDVGGTTGDESTGAPTPTTTGDESTGEPACVEDDLQTLDFKGPGYDPENGGLVPPLQDGYVASTTVLVLRPDKMNDFFGVAGAMFGVLEANPGLVGYSLASSAKCGTQRTLTIWRDEAAMFAFVASPEHQNGAGMAAELSTTGTVTAWDITQAEVPVAWADAIARVDALPKTY